MTGEKRKKGSLKQLASDLPYLSSHVLYTEIWFLWVVKSDSFLIKLLFYFNAQKYEYEKYMNITKI